MRLRGSLRRDSLNRQLVNAVQRLKQSISLAHGLLFATPERYAARVTKHAA